MHVSNVFHRQFTHLQGVLHVSHKILLVAHMRPDPDAVGSVVALKHYIEDNYHAEVTIGCSHPLLPSLAPLFPDIRFSIVDSDQIDLTTYDLAIGCDSVNRGFDVVLPRLDSQCVTVVIDHHHDIQISADIRIIDPSFASTTELLYHFFLFDHGTISPRTATALLTGIIGDTGIFQYANTSPRTLEVAAALSRLGASIPDIVSASFTNQKVETLNLWGSALENASFDTKTGIVTTALTSEDLAGRTPTSEEVKHIATILTNSPNVKAVLFLFQAGPSTIKASLRARPDAGIDVSAIARKIGGGGHPLASGFEVAGRLNLLRQGVWEVT